MEIRPDRFNQGSPGELERAAHATTSRIRATPGVVCQPIDERRATAQS